MTAAAKRSLSVDARERRQRRIVLRVLARVGPELLAVSNAAHDAASSCDSTGGRPSAAVPHLRAVRRHVDAALAALAKARRA
jgi:hypothetical protein